MSCHFGCHQLHSENKTSDRVLNRIALHRKRKNQTKRKGSSNDIECTLNREIHTIVGLKKVQRGYF